MKQINVPGESVRHVTLYAQVWQWEMAVL